MCCLSVREPGVKLRLLTAGSGLAADQAAQISMTNATV